VAELLLAHHADLRAKDKHGSTPVQVAAAAGHQDLADALSGSRAEPHAGTPEGAGRPTQKAPHVPLNPARESLPDLQAATRPHFPAGDSPAQPAVRECYQEAAGSSPQPHAPPASGAPRPQPIDPGSAILSDPVVLAAEMHDAVRNGDLARVRALLQVSSSLALGKDAQGKTPLDYAAEAGQTNVAAALLAAGADVNARDQTGWTPLLRAAQRGHQDTAKLLLESKADVNARSTAGVTPLHWAASNGDREMAELLLARGADVNAHDGTGVTPLYWATIYGHKDVADLLHQHGGHD
jgi:hypothetical protein